ncbi:TIGR03943 family protein [Ammoniphilus sp. YIM 78166]|uniref:TIGR03943 family putative permease subunit n=1 Tax=Ammoniphilus sp. YIM 78166 TaxID=1644106 RepID=UPI00143007A9|nr:TIGR03943 family protein [Ammoniphilus sp. YIM 78166]
MLPFSQQVLRAFILLGFSSFLFMLHHTGEMGKYINMKYAGLSKIASLIFLLLFFIQIKNLWFSEGSAQEHECHDGCDHDHGFTPRWSLKTTVSYLIILVPLATGFLLPAKTLDAAIAQKKGVLVSIPAPPPTSAPKNTSSEGHFEPLTLDSSNAVNTYGNDLYEQALKEVLDMPTIRLEGKTFAPYADAIFLHPDQLIGKPIELTGFVYKEEQMKEDELVLARFLITHCIADASVIGFLAQMEDAAILPQDAWIEVKGVLDIATYGDFEMPRIKVESWKTVERPEDPYVYP